MRSFEAKATPLIFHVISGAGIPTAKQGRVTSSLYVVVYVSSNEAILAGTKKIYSITYNQQFC